MIMIIKNKSFKLLSYILFTLILITSTICGEYRSIDGRNNNINNPSAGIPETPFLRNFTQKPLYADANNNLIPTPGNYISAPPATVLSCADTLPDGTYPLPRCISNKIASRQSKDEDMFDITRLEKFKSKRKISHMLTYWGLFVKMDVSSGYDTGLNYPNGIYIPQDDQIYLSSYKNGPKPADFTFAAKTLQFNRSVPDGGNTGINQASSFLDGSTIYGNNEAALRLVRDYGNRGKLFLETDSTPDGAFGFPPVDANGHYIYGYSAEFGRNVFTDFFHILFVREHNRLCEEFFAIHGNNWDDETYFQEARRWVIAFIQKITYYEYLGTALGTPLTKYDGYKPSLVPAIDTFFATVTYRYGHSEISDFYNLVNPQGETLTTLGLNDIENSQLIKIYGLPLVALTLALQRQEEVDIYVADFARYYRHNTDYMDITSLDAIRSRDHGIPSYNEARASFGLSRKTSFAEISSDPEVQQKLQETYITVDRIEALMGGLAEDHVNGGNYGELFYKSFSEEWANIRAFDRFWYENGDAGFSQDEITKIQATTLLDIIKRNTPESSYYPQNLWFVQPPTAPKIIENDKGYNSPLSLSDDYSIQWKLGSTNITFLITISSAKAWFGIGFNPNGNAMTDTDMMIFKNSDDGTSVTGKNYIGIGLGIKPKELDDNDQIITISNPKVEGGVTTLEVTRPLNGKNRKSLEGSIQMVYAWNPSTNVITYHGGNRGQRTINFQSGATTDITDSRPRLLRIHGIAMFIIWGVLFPGSVWIVRYLRHIDSYMVQHRNINLFGAMAVGIFAAIAITVTTTHAASAHAIIGITIISITVLQISLGILAIWSLANVESASTGIVRYLKHFHFYLGAVLLLAAWTNIFFGMITYDQKFGGNRGEYKAYIWVYTAWLILFGFIVTASEFYYKIKNMQFLWPVKKSNDLTNRRIRNCIPDYIYENLPAISWKEFNKRVMTGANLVVAEGLIFDIHKWIPLHPGGQKILQRVIGTDITNDFFFDPIVKTVIQNNFKDDYDVKEPSISILTDNTYKEKSDIPLKSRPYSVASAVDMINATAFRNRRVAMHRHSKFATSKLASMVIARIIESEDNFSNHEKMLNQPSTYSPNVFRRYILTNIEVVTRHNAENPVKKLMFQVIHPKDRLPKFIPGDYIEIMSYTNNHVIIRPYTPLQGPTENSFYILVKIYKDGIMSQHLNRQLKNFEVKVRGPFDIADRMETSPSSSAIDTNSIITRPSSANSTSRPTFNTFNRNAYKDYKDFIKRSNSIVSLYDNNPKFNSIVNSDFGKRSGILFNKEKEDLCWDYCFMVSGGTGIAPMLQLIQYYKEAASSNTNFMLYLLAAFDKIDDLIYPKYLDYLCQSLDGRLEVKYILYKPPAIWRDYSGLIDEALLFDWISERYMVPPPAIPPKMTNYGGGNNLSNLSVGIQNSQTHNINAYSYYSGSNDNLPISPVSPTQDYDEQMFDTYNQQSTSTAPVQIPFNNNSRQQRNSPSTSPYSSYSPHLSPTLPHATNQIILMNERYNYMNLLAKDNSKQIKLIVCGSDLFNKNIRISLEKLGFPIDEKAIFIC